MAAGAGRSATRGVRDCPPGFSRILPANDARVRSINARARRGYSRVWSLTTSGAQITISEQNSEPELRPAGHVAHAKQAVNYLNNVGPWTTRAKRHRPVCTCAIALSAGQMQERPPQEPMSPQLDCWLTILLVLGMKPRLLDGAHRDSPVDSRAGAIVLAAAYYAPAASTGKAQDATTRRPSRSCPSRRRRP